MIMHGITVFPVQSRIFADGGIAIFFEFPVLAILPLMIRMAWSFFSGAPVPSMIFAWISATVSVFMLTNCFTAELNCCEYVCLLVTVKPVNKQMQKKIFWY